MPAEDVEGTMEVDAAEYGAAGATPIEPIGDVPGPRDGVYGDPPNTGGTEDPEKRAWRYDTDYFFVLTRSLERDTDLSASGRRWVVPWTVLFDVATLPTAALAGLSGRGPDEVGPPMASASPASSSAPPRDPEADATDTPG